MHTIFQEHALHIVGIELRTSNAEAMRTIPPHWQRFSTEQIARRVPNALGEDVFAVYTNFQNAGRDNLGLYSLVIGLQVDPASPVPPGLARAVAPISRRAVFSVPRGRNDLVGTAWADVSARTDLARTYIADYERYHNGGEIDLLVGITSDAHAP